MPRIKDLTTKTGTLSSADQFVSDDGTNVTKIDYTALAKAIIEQYNGSSVAGSSQSLKSALDSLNSKLETQLLGNNPNFDNITENGFYYFSDVINAVNPPNADAGYLNMMVINGGYMITQIVFGGRQITQGGRDYIWVRYKNGGTWNPWIAYAKQSAMDAVTTALGNMTNQRVSVAANSTQEVSLTAWGVYLVCALRNFYIVYAQSATGTPVLNTIQEDNTNTNCTAASGCKINLENTSTTAAATWSVTRLL